MLNFVFRLPTELVGCCVFAFLDFGDIVKIDSSVVPQKEREVLLQWFSTTSIGSFELRPATLHSSLIWFNAREIIVQEITLNFCRQPEETSCCDEDHLYLLKAVLLRSERIHLRELYGCYRNIVTLLEDPKVLGKVCSSYVGYGESIETSKVLAHGSHQLNQIIVPSESSSAHIAAFFSKFCRWENLCSVSLKSGHYQTLPGISIMCTYLQKAVNLQTFHSTLDHLTDDMLVPLFQSCRQLRVVRIEYTSIGGRRLAEPSILSLARSCAQLREVHLAGVPMQHVVVYALCTQCKHLEALTLSSIFYGQHMLQVLLRQAHALRTLTVPCELFKTYQSESLATTLGESSAQLSSLPNLRHICVGGDCSEDCALVAARICDVAHQVTSLEMRTGSPMSAAVVTALASKCPSLTSLTLTYCTKLTDVVLEAAVVAHPHLQHLHLLRATMLTDAALIALGRHSRRLERVTINGGRGSFTDVGVAALLVGCPQLRVVELRGCNTCTNVVFDAAACHNPCLESLALYGTELNFTGAALLNMMSACRRLRKCCLETEPLVGTDLEQLTHLQARRALSVSLYGARTESNELSSLENDWTLSVY